MATTPITEAGTAVGSGTTIVFWPDAEIFGAAEFSFDGLEERFRELAFLNQGLEISLTDLRRPDEPRSVRLCFPNGARDFVAFLDGHPAAPAPMDTIAFEHEDPRMAGTMEVAFRWCGCPGERVRAFANSRPTVDGAHMVGFRDGMTAAVTTYAREQGLLTATAPGFGADRIGEGLTAVVSVKLDRPEFGGSTRGVLGNAEVRDCVGQAVRDHLGRWLEEDPERAAAVIDRIARGAACRDRPAANRPAGPEERGRQGAGRRENRTETTRAGLPAHATQEHDPPGAAPGRSSPPRRLVET
ncbi:hypothetical protein ACIO87_26710 [Streptomyces sp. NPDC087218]|uniref:hypothetical protein n=1 Tax=Streptomyces sp. NPDC087218 TaxID=3365769 RepID=UPI0037F8AA43